MKLVIYANLTVIVYVAPVELLLMHHNASTTYVVTRHHICGKNHRNIDTSIVYCTVQIKIDTRMN